MKPLPNFMKSALILFLGIILNNFAFAQCTMPVITSIGNSGPVCEGDSVQLFAKGEIGGLPTDSVRIAGIGGNYGTRAFDQVFSSGDRKGSVVRISEATFNAIAAGGPDSLRAKYDVLLFTWNSNASLNVTWPLIEGYLALGGSVFWEDQKNIGDLAPGINGFENNGSFGCNYHLVTPPPFPLLLGNGVDSCFVNHHIMLNSWPAWMKIYIKGSGGQNMAIAGIYPSGGGRLIVQGLDNDFHAVRGGVSPTGNQYDFLLNQMDFLSAIYAGVSWTGPGGFVSNLPNPALKNVTVANAGVYTAKLTNPLGGCFTTDTTIVVVNAKPNVTVRPSGSTNICKGDSVILTVANNPGASYKWKKDSILIPGATNTSYVAKSTGAYFVIVASAGGCIDTSSIINVKVVPDTIPPNAVCKNATLYLDSTGVVQINPPDVDGGSTDNCGRLRSIYVNPSIFMCHEVGRNVVILTVVDANGNQSSCRATVSVLDTIPPRAVCKNINVYLDGSGNASIVPTDVDGGSSDNCGIETMTVSQDKFSCIDLGPNRVILTVVDSSGNASRCISIVTVLDTVPPKAICKNTTVYLDSTGHASIIPTDVDGGSTDNCRKIRLSVTPSKFDCSNIGRNSVVLTVTDASGNKDSCRAIVTVLDTIPPKAICKNTTVYLDGAGHASIVPADVDGGSADNCPRIRLSVSPSRFDCSNIGRNSVVLTVTDASGNKDSCKAIVSVLDTIPPKAVCKNTTVYLDGAGHASIVPADVDGGSADNCPRIRLSVSPSRFDCSNIGRNSVVLTVTDASGNKDSCKAIVTVLDTIPPKAICKNTTVYLDGAGHESIVPADVDGGSADNCPRIRLSVSPSRFDCSNIGRNVVVLVVTDASGNSDSCRAIVTVLDTVPPKAVCKNITVYLDSAGHASIVPADVDGGSTDNCPRLRLSVSPSRFDCSNIGRNIVVLTATDASGNKDSCRAIVTVLDTIPPNAVCKNTTVYLDSAGHASIIPADVDGGSTDNCPRIRLSVSLSRFDCSNIGRNVVVLVVTDASGNSDSCRAIVTVLDTIPPVAVFKNIKVYLDSAGAAAITPSEVDGGSSDNCGLALAKALAGMSVVPSTFDCPDIGPNRATLTVEDESGNQSSATGIVTVLDSLPPKAVCKNITVYLDSAGHTSIVPADVDGGCTDNCGIESMTVSTSRFNCANLGPNRVVLTVIDSSGNAARCIAIVTVLDTIPPKAVCKNSIVFLDSSGHASIIPSAVDGGSTDNCGRVRLSVSPSRFDCSNVGRNIVVLTVTDASGNRDSCRAIVTVLDKIRPDAKCKNASIYIDSTGYARLSPADVDGGSTDNCGIDTMFVIPHIFPCHLVGLTVPVILKVIDVNGNIDICTAKVKINDSIPPKAVCKNITVYLNASGHASIVPSDVDGGSTDNCGKVRPISVSPSRFDCSNIGRNIVVLTVSDHRGNLSRCRAIVTVLDTIPPKAVCKNTIVYLDSTGNASIVPADVDGGSTDNCGRVRRSVSPSRFDCSNVGRNVVVLTATDASGNRDSCRAIVTVLDTIPPKAVCKNITVYLDSAGHASIVPADVDGGSTDNCPRLRLSVSPSRFDCSNIGRNIVVLVVTDASGNKDSCRAIVTVLDTIPPIAIFKNITIYLDTAGAASITPSEVDGGSSDNCGLALAKALAGKSVVPSTFDCPDIGPNRVKLTVEDESGNQSSATGIVTVLDSIPPKAVCKNITVYLDSTGHASIVPADVNGGCTDNCGIDSMTVSQSNFTCKNVGRNSVVLTVVDSSGNAARCIAIVTVLDKVLPSAICKDATVYLNRFGVATIDPADVDGGSFDNCGIRKMFVFPKLFTCLHAGKTTHAILTVVDVNGNVSICKAKVKVMDTIPPKAVCKNITVHLDANGHAAIVPSDVDGGSKDNCYRVRPISVSPSRFDCSNIGRNAVVLTVRDHSGNLGRCTAIVTILDTIPPKAVCKNTTVYLDSTGHAAIVPANVDGGSTDNCGRVRRSVSPSRFDCSNIGRNIVVLTVTDASGNKDSCRAIVTVLDTIPPVAVFKNITIYLDSAGSAAVTPSEVDGGSSDNCGLALAKALVGKSVVPSKFDCPNIGPNRATLTVEDETGNQSSATGIVTVLDSIPPDAVCKNITVYLDSTGQASIVPADVNGGCTDNCGIESLSVSPSSFTCRNVGRNRVVLTAVDSSGNTASCIAIVTVLDTIPPKAVCKNIRIHIDSSGHASITPSMIDGGSSDVCGIASIVASKTRFNCHDLGRNRVRLTVTDVNGNVSTCLAIVTVLETHFVKLHCSSDIQAKCHYKHGGAKVWWKEPTAQSFSSCKKPCQPKTHCKGFTYLGEHKGHRYFRSTGKHFTWEEANDSANAMGGHLLVIDGADEDGFIRGKNRGHNSWIGLHDSDLEGKFRWVLGGTPSYTNWGRRQSDNRGGRCNHRGSSRDPHHCKGYGCRHPFHHKHDADHCIIGSRDGKWHDMIGCSEHDFIMEIPCGNPVIIEQIAGPANGSMFPGNSTTEICYVAKDIVTGAKDTSCFNVTVSECIPHYCRSKAIYSRYEWIEQVELGSINNTSGNDGGYGDYTSINSVVNRGDVLNLSLIPGFAFGAFDQHWKVWVDWNKDGDFYDAGERVFIGHSSGVLNSTVTVPNYAHTGNLRVRVSMQWRRYAGPCSIFFYGEVEDYQLTVSPLGAKSVLADAPLSEIEIEEETNESEPSSTLELVKIHPNPIYQSEGSLFIEYRSAKPEIVHMNILDVSGRTLKTLRVNADEGINNVEMDVSDIAAGIYFIQIVGESSTHTEKLEIL